MFSLWFHWSNAAIHSFVPTGRIPTHDVLVAEMGDVWLARSSAPPRPRR
jgi:hypothetical protein